MPEVIFCTDSTLWDKNKLLFYSIMQLCAFKMVHKKQLCALSTLLHYYMTIFGYRSCIYISLCMPQMSYHISTIHYKTAIYYSLVNPNVSPGLVKCSQRQVVPSHWSDTLIGSFRRSRAEWSGFVNLLLSWFYIAFLLIRITIVHLPFTPELWLVCS